MVNQEVVIRYQPKAGGPKGSQLEFHRDRPRPGVAGIRTRVVFAGTGGGKTYMGCFEDLSWLIDGYRGLLAAPNKPMARRIFIPILEDLLGVKEPNWEAHPLVQSWNRTEQHLRLITGGEAWVIGLDEPEAAEGVSVDFIHVTEARLVRRFADALRSLRRRLRGSKPGNPTGLWIETHSPSKELHELFEGPQRDPEAHVYRWATRDNPILPPAYVQDVERGHTGSAYKAAILGEYARPAGLVYDEFDPARHVRPPTGKHTRVTYGIDWGWTDPTVILAIAWTGNQAHVVDEYNQSHAGIKDVTAALQRMVATWGPGKAWCGADQPEHIHDLVKAGFLAEGFKGKRIRDGVLLLKDRLRGNELLIAPACLHTLDELDRYAYPPEGGDDPEAGFDHAMDAMRYGIVGGAHGGRRLVGGIGW